MELSSLAGSSTQPSAIAVQGTPQRRESTLGRGERFSVTVWPLRGRDTNPVEGVEEDLDRERQGDLSQFTPKLKA
jgi:hypothetical protein